MKREVEDAHIYFPVKVLHAMRKLAEKNRRSVTAEMVIAAERYITSIRKDAQKLTIFKLGNRDDAPKQ